MPRKSSKASELEEMRAAGIGLAAKFVLENKYDQAKDITLPLITYT